MQPALRLLVMVVVLCAAFARADSEDDPLGRVKQNGHADVYLLGFTPDGGRVRVDSEYVVGCSLPDGGLEVRAGSCVSHPRKPDWPPPMPTNADIMRVVASHKDQIKACVALQPRPGSPGMLQMHWELKQTGATGAIRCDTEALRDSAMAKCLAAEIATWKFPVFVGEPLPVDFPFHF